MNWRRLYAAFQIYLVVGGAAVVGATFWAMVIAGICRFAFELDENAAVLFIFIPLFLALAIYLVKALPKPLRRAGMLSDEPERFGPWLATRPKNESD
jgi:hypothetical protein